MTDVNNEDEKYISNLLMDKELDRLYSFEIANTNIEFAGNTTMLYSKLVDSYFNEEYIPYVELSDVVKAKIVATKGE